MAENQPHRDFCQRQHRVIGNYLAIEAWVRGLDCIVLVRSDLEGLFHLQRFKSTRVEWMIADFRPWFPYQQPYYRTNARSSIHSIFLSRVPIGAHLPRGSMTTEERIRRMEDDAPRTARFSRDRQRVPDEAEILSRLAVLAAGLDAPKKQIRRRRKKR